MTHEGPPIDWRAFDEAGKGGGFMELLAKLPRERWAERDEAGFTLLHLACCGPNLAAVVALLQSGLVDVNARKRGGHMPAHFAAWRMQPRVLEVLCAAGADLRARDDRGLAPINYALMKAYKDGSETVCVLVANGVRLSTVRDIRLHRLPKLEAFEHGVLRCRAAVVAMLRVKRAGKLVRWDKFLLMEIAVAVWSSRYDKGWQTAAQQHKEEDNEDDDKEDNDDDEEDNDDDEEEDEADEEEEEEAVDDTDGRWCLIH